MYPGRCGMLSTGKHMALSLHLHFKEYAWDNHTTLNYPCSKGEQATAEGSHSRDSWLNSLSLSISSFHWITALHSEKHKGTHSQASDNPSLTAGKKLVVTSGSGKICEFLTNSGHVLNWQFSSQSGKLRVILGRSSPLPWPCTSKGPQGTDINGNSFENTAK